MDANKSSESPQQITAGILRAFETGVCLGKIADEIAAAESRLLSRLLGGKDLAAKLREEQRKMREELLAVVEREHPDCTSEDIDLSIAVGAEYAYASRHECLVREIDPVFAAQMGKYAIAVHTHSLQSLEWLRRKRQQGAEQTKRPTGEGR